MQRVIPVSVDQLVNLLSRFAYVLVALALLYLPDYDNIILVNRGYKVTLPIGKQIPYAL